MPVGLLGRKVGMTRVYDAAGLMVPVTVLQAGPCTVLQVRTPDRDGYEAVQLGYVDKPRRSAIRSERGHVAALGSKRSKALQNAGVALLPKAECEPKRYVREFRTDGESHGLGVGQAVDVTVFAEGTRIDVIGTSKGRGTAGVMKRHGFAGMPASHGAKKVHRQPGSTGMSTDPHRVLKGTRMAGRYGNTRVTSKELRVVRVDAEHALILVEGAVPGPNGGLVVLRHSKKKKKKPA
jgi:large subunit ribosomal protein L3